MEHAEEAVVALCCFLEVLRSPLCLGSVHKIQRHTDTQTHVCVFCVCVREREREAELFRQRSREDYTQRESYRRNACADPQLRAPTPAHRTGAKTVERAKVVTVL